jgi:hypothetical protein
MASVCHRVGPITARKRAALPESAFGLPGERKYPIPDPKHAAAAKGRARQQLERGALSRSKYNQIVHRADQVIARCAHGRLGMMSRSEEEWFLDNAHWLLPLFTFMGGLTFGAMLFRKPAPA